MRRFWALLALACLGAVWLQAQATSPKTSPGQAAVQDGLQLYQDARYQEFRALMEDDPVWYDGDWVPVP